MKTPYIVIECSNCGTNVMVGSEAVWAEVSSANQFGGVGVQVCVAGHCPDCGTLTEVPLG